MAGPVGDGPTGVAMLLRHLLDLNFVCTQHVRMQPDMVQNDARFGPYGPYNKSMAGQHNCDTKHF
ncbi:hypothetical protein BLOT_008329 [Blomia tropicalis]|nr:hypothetical protein BLOT_008329 [Blomia tropicalis]